MRKRVIARLKELTGHDFVEVVTRGNSAIRSALRLVKKGLLVPSEGGWLTYKDYPEKMGLKFEFVDCKDAKIDIGGLKEKLSGGEFDVFLYQNPGGYFAEQPMKEICEVCKEYGCLVVLDASGGIGTDLCDGKFADVILGSFGRWKLVEAKGGGFISSKNEEVFEKLELEVLEDTKQWKIIEKELKKLPKRIDLLLKERELVIADLKSFDVLYKDDLGFVVVVAYDDLEDKEKIVKYCKEHKLEFTECPRYITVQRNAISIELKRNIK